MDEPVDIVLQLHEGAEAGELRYFAVHQITDLVFFIDRFPRIFGQLLNTETDPLVNLVDVDDNGFDFIALS